MDKALSRAILAAGTVALTLLSSAASAQAVSQRFDDLLVRLKPGDVVWVTGDTPDEVKGRIVDLTRSGLILTTDDGPREFAAASVTRIRQRYRDPVWEGALIGAAAAVVPLVVWFAPMTESGETFGENLGFVTLMVAIGAGAGAGIDALKQGRRVIYLAPRRSPARVHVAPMLSTDVKGLRLSFRF